MEVEDFSLFPYFMPTYAFYSQPFLTNYGYDGCYRTIITINMFPQGPLARLVTRARFKPLSHFQAWGGECDPRKRCGLALRSLGGSCGLMSVDELPELYSFLLSNGYKIDTSLTKMTNQSSVVLNNGNNCAQLLFFATF